MKFDFVIGHMLIQNRSQGIALGWQDIDQIFL
jgi:hypothetical protein